MPSYPSIAIDPTRRLSARESLEIEARRQGFSEVGVTDLAPFDQAAARARQALAEGRLAGMPWYTAERIEKARDLSRRFPWGRSLVALAYPYRPAATPLEKVSETLTSAEPPRGRIAGYALGEDYHVRLDRALRRLTERIAETSPGLRWHRFVDHGWALDRAIAARAGLGFTGKHSQLIAGRGGSYVLLASLVLNLELSPDRPSRRNCGSCRACLPSCPTGALVAPGVIDAPRCISYLTIEHPGPIPVALRPLMGTWVFGCDLCQEACPINARLSEEAVAAGPATTASGPVPYPDLAELLSISEAEFEIRFSATTMRRSGRERLARNAAVALGNAGQRSAVPALTQSLRGDPAPAVRGASAWALGQLGGGRAVAGLRLAHAQESDPEVIGEIEAALSQPALAADSRRRELNLRQHSA
ncbi:MAG: tRNA epoxyqueuosine(34) reductase QueG [Candidatus Dormiibacterota bacterium]